MTVSLPILEQFAEASPSLLEKRSLLRRIDSKFLVSVEDLEAILSQITADYGIVLAGGNRLATYRTIYYDTPELRCFHDHRRGRRPRQKVRVRHYDDRSVSYLEIKTKRSEYISAKSRKPQAFNFSALDAEGLAFVDKNSRLLGSSLVPSVNTDFQRATLVGLETQERITLDVNLTVSQHQDPVVPLNGIAIVEVKQARLSTRTPVMQALVACGHRPASASKYCTATALLRPGLRMNRLLPALRAIERLRK